MNSLLKEKYEKLTSIVEQMGSVAIAFSGGVDSVLLMEVAHKVLGDAALAITVASEFFPESEAADAKEFCTNHGIAHHVIYVDVLGIEGIRYNPKDRCYRCKSTIFSAICNEAIKSGCEFVADGTNVDDAASFRPGLTALAELGVTSPLAEAGLSKAEIRDLSCALGLASATKPSMACLATRVPYGMELSRPILKMVEEGEDYLRKVGFSQLRVRVEGAGSAALPDGTFGSSKTSPVSARIEILPEQFPLMLEEQMRQNVHTKLREIGFMHVSLDILGFRSGSMDETPKEANGE